MRAAGVRPLVLVWTFLAGCAPAVTRPAAAPPPARVDTATVVLLGTTDVHGRLYNHDYYTGRRTDHGLILLKPIIDSIRGQHPGRTLLFDSGDLLQGNPLAYLYARTYADQPNPIIRAMNLLAYDAAAIGNHEFNYGLDQLARATAQAVFPFVSANIFRAGTARHAYRPYVLLPVVTGAADTLLVGVTGNTPPGVHLWDRENVTGVLDFREVVASVGRVVADMRQQGADIVVVLSHGGLEGTSYDTVTTGLPPENAAAELARSVPQIDVIFLGHTHREVADTTINGVLLTQARYWGGSLAVATLRAERTVGTAWRVTSKRSAVIRPAAGRGDPSFADSLRWEHERTVAWVTRRIGRATERMDAAEARVRDTPIIDFINAVQRRAAGADLSASAAFALAAALPAGDISIADVAQLYPYDNTLKAIRIDGAQLRAYLEKSAEYYHEYRAGGPATNFGVPGYNYDIVSGVDYTLDVSRPAGMRVTSLVHRGAPVRDEQTFTLALNNYRQAGGGGYDMIAGAPVVYDRQQDVRELLIDEIRRRGMISPADYYVENWQLLPAAAAAVALREQRARELAPATSDTQAAHRKRLRVLSTNDFHGNLAPYAPGWANGRSVGGAATLAAYFAAETETFPGPTIVVDGGDIMQGTPVSNLLRGASSIDYYNAAGYAAAAIGNHEFDWGPAVLRERIAQAHFPLLAANIFVTGTDTAPSWVRATALIERQGVRIGIIGLATPETPTETMAAHVAGLTFASGAAVIDRHVPRLRAAGADFVIVVAHEGAYCTNQTTACRGTMIDWLQAVQHRPDLVVGGHTHEVVRTRVNGIAFVEAGRWGDHYNVVDLERVRADSVAVHMRGSQVTWTDRVTPDAAVAAMVTRITLELAPQLELVVATAADSIRRTAPNSELGHLIADAQRAATGTQLALMNAGGVRAPLAPGPITWGALYRVQPFGNKLMVLRLRGTDLRAALEHTVDGRSPVAFISGAVVTYDTTRAAGSRIREIRLRSGETVRDDDSYTVTVSDFMAAGGDGYAIFRRALEQQATGVIDLDALIEYVRALPQPVQPPRDIRFQPLPRR
ncbi:MAG TPA: 5'-nucleotidase C-terminal domain-containing protein [Longimicrobiales bacterium]|nr:5'-nucleotidase C-terminal domain-containing protein [Longimicrobiales bacterium]